MIANGGDVFDGLAIYNVIKRHPGPVNVSIDGIAASIASVVAMSGNKIVMPENTFMMIHDPFGFAMGTADDMRDLADVLDKIKGSLASTYVAKSGQPLEKINELMSEETWLTAKEAKDLGLADEVIPEMKIAARADLDRFKSPPEALKAAASEHTSDPPPAPEPAPEPAPQPPVDPAAIRGQAVEEANRRAREVYDLCAKAGVPDAAGDFLSRGMTVEQVRERLAEAPAIRDVCAAAHVPDRASDYIKKGLNLK